MRTKTLLAAAILAAGLASSMAQNVYSLNIVGYVNLPIKASGYSLLVNPLSQGVSNGGNEVLSFMLTDPKFDDSTIVLYDPVAIKYLFYQYDQATPGWLDAAGVPTSVPLIPPGTGFFFNNASTNTSITLVGTVTPNPGITNHALLRSGYSLVGSTLPIGGVPTNSGPNQLNMPFDTGGGSTLVTYFNGAYTFYANDGGWINAAGNPGPQPVLSVGQGFFFNNNAGSAFTNWSQVLILP